MPASRTLLAIGAGLTAAILFAAWRSGSFLALALTPFASLPLLVAGLSLGVSAAVIAAVAATIAVLLVGGMALAIIFAVINAAPVVFLARQALLQRRGSNQQTEWYPPGMLVMWLAGIATAGFIALLIANIDADGGLEAQLRTSMADALKQMAPPDAPEGANEAVANMFARFVPGVFAVAWMQMIALNAVLAQAILAFAKQNLRPSPRMADIELPAWLPVGAAIVAVGAFMPGFSGFVGANLLLVVLATFVFAGLAVIHAFAAGWNNSRLWLTLVYIATLGFTGPAVLVALLGVADTSLNLRRRIAARTPGR
jgi:uncharacterized protein YybS (DUF2232 family)